MSTLFVLLFLIASGALILGLVSPRVVLRSEKTEASRKQVLKIYGSAAFVFLILTGITAPDEPSGTSDRQVPSERPEASPPPGAARRDSTGNIVADTFSIRYDLNGRHLTVGIVSDLPDETQVMVSVDRNFRQRGTKEDYVVSYFSEESTVGAWRIPHRINLDDAAWKASLANEQRISAAAGQPFIVSTIDSTVAIEFTVPINQDAPFEPRNQNLVGAAVTQEAFGRVIEKSEELTLPLDATGVNQTRWADPMGLEVGKAYTVSRDTPVMPSADPADPMKALANMHTLRAGYAFSVLRTMRVRGTLWYQVRVGEGVVEGWVNAVALVGQEVVAR